MGYITITYSHLKLKANLRYPRVRMLIKGAINLITYQILTFDSYDINSKELL